MYGCVCLYFQVAEDAVFKVVPVEVERDTVSLQLTPRNYFKKKFFKNPSFVADSLATNVRSREVSLINHRVNLNSQPFQFFAFEIVATTQPGVRIVKVLL